MPGINNTPEELWQRLQRTERRLERLESKYSDGIDVSTQPAVIVPENFGAPYYGEKVNNGFGVWTTHYKGYWLGSISNAVRVAFDLDMGVGATDIEVRLQAFLFDLGVPTSKDVSSSATFSNAGAGANEYIEFNWLHKIDPAPYQAFYVEIQTLNNTDPFGGSIDVHYPPVFHQARAEIIGATASGL